MIWNQIRFEKKKSKFVYDEKKAVLARATLDGLVGRVVVRGPPVARP